MTKSKNLVLFDKNLNKINISEIRRKLIKKIKSHEIYDAGKAIGMVELECEIRDLLEGKK